MNIPNLLDNNCLVQSYSEYCTSFKSPPNSRFNEKYVIINKDVINEGIRIISKIVRYCDKETNKKYIVKITKNEDGACNEIKISNIFKNTHIVKIHSNFLNQDTGKSYLIMDFIEGDTFKNFLNDHKDKKISLEQGKKILTQILLTTCIFLEQNIIPNDLHFENLMIGPNEHVTFIDFEAYSSTVPEFDFFGSPEPYSFFGLNSLDNDLKEILKSLFEITQEEKSGDIKDIQSRFKPTLDIDIEQKIESYSKFINSLKL